MYSQYKNERGAVYVNEEVVRMAMKPKKLSAWERIAFQDDDCEIALVGRGRRAYLWCGKQRKNAGGYQALLSFSGPKSLRKLAKKILEEIPDE